MKTLALPTAIALTLLLNAAAPAQSPATHDPARVEAGTYSVDPAHTQVIFSVSHMGFSNFTGSFTNASGELTLDPKVAGASALKVTVPIASVLTTSPKLNEELKGAQWLDASRYPAMTFASTKVTSTGHGKATVTGDLTIHGVTKPATLAVSFIGAGASPLNKKYTGGFEAKGEIKRSDFGVKTYVPLIGDTLHLTIAGVFERE